MSEINSDIKLDKISEDKKFGLILTLKIKSPFLTPIFYFYPISFAPPVLKHQNFEFLSDLLVLTLYLSLFRNSGWAKK